MGEYNSAIVALSQLSYSPVFVRNIADDTRVLGSVKAPHPGGGSSNVETLPGCVLNGLSTAQPTKRHYRQENAPTGILGALARVSVDDGFVQCVDDGLGYIPRW